TWRNVVPNQSVYSVVSVPQTREMFFTTSIHGGSSAIPTEKEAFVILWDVVTQSIAWQVQPLPGATSYDYAAVGEDQRIYGTSGGHFFIFDPASREVLTTGTLPTGRINSLCFSKKPAGPDRALYALGGDA